MCGGENWFRMVYTGQNDLGMGRAFTLVKIRRKKNIGLL